MKKLPLVKYIIFVGAILFGIGLDQLTKFLAVRFLEPVHSVPILKGVLHLTYVENTGAAFGMLKDARWVFMIVSTVAIIGLLIYLFSGRVPNPLYEVSIIMIISGGIGNMIDRIALGYVVDFIDFCLIDFAVFNGADSFVSVGAVLLVFALLIDIFMDSKKGNKNAN